MISSTFGLLLSPVKPETKPGASAIEEETVALCY